MPLHMPLHGGVAGSLQHHCTSLLRGGGVGVCRVTDDGSAHRGAAHTEACGDCCHGGGFQPLGLGQLAACNRRSFWAFGAGVSNPSTGAGFRAGRDDDGYIFLRSNSTRFLYALGARTRTCERALHVVHAARMDNWQFEKRSKGLLTLLVPTAADMARLARCWPSAPTPTLSSEARHGLWAFCTGLGSCLLHI